MAEIHRTSFGGSDSADYLEERAWKLFILLPRLLLFKTSRGGKAGERNLRDRITLFDTGQWDILLRESQDFALSHPFYHLRKIWINVFNMRFI